MKKQKQKQSYIIFRIKQRTFSKSSFIRQHRYGRSSIAGLLRCFLPTRSTSNPVFINVKQDLLTRWSVTKSLITDTITRFKLNQIMFDKITYFYINMTKNIIFLKIKRTDGKRLFIA